MTRLLSCFIAEPINAILNVIFVIFILRKIARKGVLLIILTGRITAFIVGFALKEIGENFRAGEVINRLFCF